MGLVESLNIDASPEVEEGYLQPGRSDRVHDYNIGSDSSDTNRGKSIMKGKGVSDYGTQEDKARAATELKVGGLHKVEVGETIPVVMLKYRVNGCDIRCANPQLGSRCAVDDSDLGDLTVLVIPRTVPLAKAKATLHKPFASLNPMYQDSQTAITPSALHVKHLISSCASLLHAQIPHTAINTLTPLSAQFDNENSILPWDNASVDVTGYLLLTLKTPTIPLSDGTSVKVPLIVTKGIVLQVHSVFDFLRAIKPYLAAALP